MAKWHLTDEAILAQIAVARERERQLRKTEPRAKRAHYDRARGMVVIELLNGSVFAFPARLAQGLRGASPDELAAVEVSPSGEGLHWERLDADLRVPALLQGLFGTKAWMAELGRLGGKVRSPAKARAARANGAKGGRPRKRSVRRPS